LASSGSEELHGDARAGLVADERLARQYPFHVSNRTEQTIGCAAVEAHMLRLSDVEGQDMETLLIVLLVLFLIGGGGFWYRRRRA